MTFNSEAEFENALIAELKNKGWEQEVIYHPSEADLLQNWATITRSHALRGNVHRRAAP